MTTPEQYQKLNELFERICQLPAEERPGALEEVPPELRPEVQALLEEDGSHPSFLANPAIARLKRLILHHHYISPELREKLAALGPEVDLDDPHEPDSDDDYRYVAVSE